MKSCPIYTVEERECEERAKKAREKDVADAMAKAEVARHDATSAQYEVKAAIERAEAAEKEYATVKAKVNTMIVHCKFASVQGLELKNTWFSM